MFTRDLAGESFYGRDVELTPDEAETVARVEQEFFLLQAWLQEAYAGAERGICPPFPLGGDNGSEAGQDIPEPVRGEGDEVGSESGDEPEVRIDED